MQGKQWLHVIPNGLVLHDTGIDTNKSFRQQKEAIENFAQHAVQVMRQSQAKQSLRFHPSNNATCIMFELHAQVHQYLIQ